MRRRGTRPALRLVVLLFIFTLLFASVAVRLVMLQIVRAAPLDSLGLQQRISTIELPAQRGAIFDRNMVPLAVSSDARALYADAQRITDPAGAATKISPILGIDVKTLTAKLSQQAGFVYLARKVPVDVAERVLALRIPYVGALDETARTYPSNDLAGQVLGFVNVDNVGLSGLESMYNKVLSGTPGKQVIEHDPQGRAIPQGRNSIVDPVNGNGIQTTIDRDIQFYAEQALARGARATGAQNGTAVVLDAKTGDVLAMANWPALNPNNFGTATPAEMRNRIVTDAYEPGSVNKVITASAAIEAARTRTRSLSRRTSGRSRLRSRSGSGASTTCSTGTDTGARPASGSRASRRASHSRTTSGTRRASRRSRSAKGSPSRRCRWRWCTRRSRTTVFRCSRVSSAGWCNPTGR
ncbi:MAG: penicillin-binding protein 2 [Actinobacteria bacterium]|nr:MAG: penicillin-binding protein 2 [Actinomycetota bacterium]